MDNFDDMSEAVRGTKPGLEALFEATSLHRPEDAVGFLLWRVAHRYQREIDRACADIDLTHLQFVVLVIAAWLSRSEKVVTQSGLAAFSGIHAMQVSNVLKALEEKTLVSRRRHTLDERSKLIEITTRGLEVLAGALPRIEQAQRSFFGTDLEASEELHTALRRIVGSWA